MRRKSRATIIALVAALSIISFMAMPGTGGADAKEAEKSKTITFSKDIAPILNRSCVSCHRPGEVAPMSLLTYKEARPWAKSIKEKVVTREMPPWHADPAHGSFTNDRSLTQKEIDTITAWVDQGAKEGDRNYVPPAESVTRDWQIGKPDIIVTMPEEYTVAATGPDEYLTVRIPTDFKQDLWVQAVELQPGNRKIVHHLIARVETPRPQAQTQAQSPRELPKEFIFFQDKTLLRLKPETPVFDDGCATPAGGKGNWMDGSRKQEVFLPGGSASTLAVYAPGTSPQIWPVGTARRIPAGSNIILELHYNRTGKVEKDRSRIGLALVKEPPDKSMVLGLLANHYFQIPPGAPNHRATACATLQQDAHLHSVFPHMHYRGQSMTVRAIYPDGSSKMLLSVPRYKMMWQTAYYFKEPEAVPKGTRIEIVGYFDNSDKNKLNPDPSSAVRWGDTSVDEMLALFVEFTIDSEHMNKITPDRVTPSGGQK